MSLSGLDPVPLSKIGTRLLASLSSKRKNRNFLACLRNGSSYYAVTYCSEFTVRWATPGNCTRIAQVVGRAAEKDLGGVYYQR